MRWKENAVGKTQTKEKQAHFSGTGSVSGACSFSSPQPRSPQRVPSHHFSCTCPAHTCTRPPNPQVHVLDIECFSFLNRVLESRQLHMALLTLVHTPSHPPGAHA